MGRQDAGRYCENWTVCTWVQDGYTEEAVGYTCACTDVVWKCHWVNCVAHRAKRFSRNIVPTEPVQKRYLQQYLRPVRAPHWGLHQGCKT